MMPVLGGLAMVQRHPLAALELVSPSTRDPSKEHQEFESRGQITLPSFRAPYQTLLL